MKSKLLTMLLLVLISSPSFSQYPWATVIYHYQTGSIPPPYFYSYDLNITSSGDVYLKYTPGYENDTVWSYSFKISDDTLKLLNDEILESKMLSEIIEELPNNKRPIGGSLMNVTVVMNETNPNVDHPPKTISTPFFPTDSYKENLNKLYDFIKKLVPQSIWDDVNGKEEVYRSNRK